MSGWGARCLCLGEGGTKCAFAFVGNGTEEEKEEEADMEAGVPGWDSEEEVRRIHDGTWREGKAEQVDPEGGAESPPESEGPSPSPSPPCLLPPSRT